MSTHRITVTIDSSTITVHPETLVMPATDDVVWSATDGRRFSIELDSDRVFGARELAHERATTPQRPRARGRFKYTVISGDDPRLRLDPVIIVEDPPTGNTP